MEEHMAYIARRDCGCIVAATVDTPDHKRETAKDVASWVREGLDVSRVACQYVRDNMRSCPHKVAAEMARKTI